MKLITKSIIKDETGQLQSKRAEDHPHEWRWLSSKLASIHKFYCIYCLTIVEVDEDV